jgi:hypothetical protein
MKPISPSGSHNPTSTLTQYIRQQLATTQAVAPPHDTAHVPLLCPAPRRPELAVSASSIFLLPSAPFFLLPGTSGLCCATAGQTPSRRRLMGGEVGNSRPDLKPPPPPLFSSFYAHHRRLTPDFKARRRFDLSVRSTAKATLKRRLKNYAYKGIQTM